jgi:hypothetical protein
VYFLGFFGVLFGKKKVFAIRDVSDGTGKERTSDKLEIQER